MGPFTHNPIRINLNVRGLKARLLFNVLPIQTAGLWEALQIHALQALEDLNNLQKAKLKLTSVYF